MYKLVTSSAHSGYGVSLRPGDLTLRSAVRLEKLSEDLQGQTNFLSSVNNIEPRVREWILGQNLDHAKNIYIIVVPLGADESWEETVNGDAFLREDLRPEEEDWGHKSFERFAHAFRNHKNSDPTQGFGDVPFTCYNDEMDRVEGIWRLNRDLARQVGASDVLSEIDRTGTAELSMGCHVKHDVCSVCGNKAKSLREYCIHPRNPGFGSIDPYSGMKVRVYNPRPKFFDLSAVKVPAAPEAHVLSTLSPEMVTAISALTKTSGATHLAVPSAVLAAWRWGKDASLYLPEYVKTSSAKFSDIKLSDLIKNAPVLDSVVIRPVQEDEDELDDGLLKDAGMDRYPLPVALSTLLGLGVVPSPREYTRITVMCSGGEEDPPPDIPSPEEISSCWDEAPECPLVSPAMFSPVLAHRMRGAVPGRSVLFPHLCSRIAGADTAVPVVSPKDSCGNKSPRLAQALASFYKTVSVALGELVRTVCTMYPQHEVMNLGAGEPLTKAAQVGHGMELGSLPAAALFPSAYILGRAGRGSDAAALEKSAAALNIAGAEHLFGGLVKVPR